MWCQDFQDGGPGGYLWQPNGTILAILNLYVTPMLPIKFRLNPTYGLGRDVVWRIPRYQNETILAILNGTILAILNLYVTPMPPINFQLNPTYGLGGCRFKNFKMAILDIKSAGF